LKNATVFGGNYALLQNWTGYGGFIGWNIIAENDPAEGFSAWSNTLNYVYGQVSAATSWGIAARFLLNISSDTVRQYNLNFKFAKEYVTDQYNVWVRFYFMDGTYFSVCNKTTALMDNVYHMYSGTLPHGKYIYQLQCRIENQLQSIAWVRFYCNNESYFGFTPEIWTYLDYTGIPKAINTDIQFATFARNCSSVQCHFLTAWGTTHDVNLISDWTYQYHFYNFEAFHCDVLYRYYYIASNEWGVATVSPLCFLSSMEHPFPQTAALALYSTIDFLGEDTSQFQYFMGDSEEDLKQIFLKAFEHYEMARFFEHLFETMPLDDAFAEIEKIFNAASNLRPPLPTYGNSFIR
jgi:hypothetical protein